MKKYHLTTTAIRRIIYFSLILIAYILQFIIIPATRFPFPVLLLVPLGTCIAMAEKEFAGMFWGLLTGILWDMASPLTDGLMALIFTVLFLTTGLLCRYTVRITPLTAVIFTSAFSLIPSFTGIMFSADAVNKDFLLRILTSETLPSAVISAILSVPFYYLIQKINKHFHRERS